MGDPDLTGWIQLVDWQAPLVLADKTGFTYDPKTLSLEVTDGQTVLSDYVTMDLQDWLRRLTRRNR